MAVGLQASACQSRLKPGLEDTAATQYETQIEGKKPSQPRLGFFLCAEGAHASRTSETSANGVTAPLSRIETEAHRFRFPFLQSQGAEWKKGSGKAPG